MPLDLFQKILFDPRAAVRRTSAMAVRGIALLVLMHSMAASAQSLTGTWSIADGTGLAKCRAVLVDGTKASSSYTIGPLEITQSGSAIYVRSLERALLYQGVVHLAENGVGSGIATSCDAITGTASDVPGTFYFSKVTPLKDTIKGTFVGHWQNSSDILSCKFAATRNLTSDPMIPACP